MSAYAVRIKAAPNMRVWRNSSENATFVQVWVCKGPKFDGMVYDQNIAIQKFIAGCDIEQKTCIRWDDGRRNVVKGVATFVAEFLEGHDVLHEMTDDNEN